LLDFHVLKANCGSYRYAIFLARRGSATSHWSRKS
jgi:hypothetical protein